MLVMIIVVVFILMIDHHNYKKENKQKTSEIVNENNPKNINKLTSIKINQIQDFSYDNLEGRTSILTESEDLCGFDYSDLKHNFDSYNKNKVLTDKQVKAKDKLIKKCEEWYDYISNISDKELELLKQNIEDINSLGLYFVNGFKKYDQNMLKEVRKIMNSGGESMEIAQSIVENLLTTDIGFIKSISYEMGSKSLNFVKGNKVLISILFGCEIEPESCSAGSMGVLPLCLMDEKECNLSVQESIANTVSPNIFTELSNAVAVIKNLIKNGYFEF